MELFEILFIAVFILFPILEQVLKRKRTPGPEEQTPDEEVEEAGPNRMERQPGGRPGGVPGPVPGREPGKASDMLPDDLWAVLTGEQRPPVGEQGSPEGVELDEAEPVLEPAEPVEAHREAKRRPVRQDTPWSIDEDPVEEPAPVSLEHYGPEAYSLERLDYEPVSLEQPLPSSEARHRPFHERIDRAPVRRRRRRSSVGKALADPESLRRAFVLSEVLDTPKGLD